MAAKAVETGSAAIAYWTCSQCGAGNSNALQICGRCGMCKNGVLPDPEPEKPKRTGSRKLKKHREPNQTEADFGLTRLEPMKQKGDIVHYGFEEITLRWADQEYTPDYFVIQQLQKLVVGAAVCPERGVFKMVEVLFIELKGGHKWQRNVNTFKTFRERTPWARFEMWQRLGRGYDWEQLA